MIADLKLWDSVHVKLIGPCRNFIRQHQSGSAIIRNNFGLTCRMMIDPPQASSRLLKYRRSTSMRLRALMMNTYIDNLPGFIDVVHYEVIWTINWLHYLNYEPIARTSSTRNLVRTRNVLGRTVSSYGWCYGIPRVVPLFRSLSEWFMSDRLSYRR